MSDNYKQLEVIASDLIKEFEVKVPPIPIESMLQQPKPDMWGEINLSQLTGSFLSVRDVYSPRVSMARLMARYAATCEWGRARGLDKLITTEEEMRAFARMLLMPREMVMLMTQGARNPVAMGMKFEVPEEDAQKRLQQLAAL